MHTLQKKNKRFVPLPAICSGGMLVCLLLIGSFIQVKAQDKNYPKDYFASPIDTLLRISGNFCELRANHIHAGLDIRTWGKEGRTILAAADGYVSRIKVSGVGYGKALYITHPNGYVSVYAHLSAFDGKIGQYVKAMQYQKQTFEVELYPGKDELTVKKGQAIALSGNTGSSGGPHLHFEIRDEKTERAINPLFFGYDIPDTEVPVVNALYLYHFSDTIFQENPLDIHTFPKRLEVVDMEGVYALKDSKKPLLVPSVFGLGIAAYDKQSFSYHLDAFYSLELKLDGQLIFYEVMDEVGFDESRLVNSHTDYYQYIMFKRLVQKNFIAKNNRLTLYKENKDRGIIRLKDTLTHSVEYIIKDYHSNTTAFTFNIKLNKKLDRKPIPINGTWFYCKKENKLLNKNISAIFPANIFYDDFKFTYSMGIAPVKGAFAPLHKLHHPLVPLHDNFILSIKTQTIKESLRPKAVVVYVDVNNSLKSAGGIWKDGFITAKVRSLGNYTVVLDTLPPKIKALFLKQAKGKKTKAKPIMENNLLVHQLGKYKSIAFTVTDNLSGVKDFDATIDGKWVLMEFDPKNNLLYYTFDADFPPGPHFFYMEVSDERGNKTVYSFEFIRDGAVE